MKPYKAYVELGGSTPEPPYDTIRDFVSACADDPMVAYVEVSLQKEWGKFIPEVVRVAAEVSNGKTVDVTTPLIWDVGE